MFCPQCRAEYRPGFTVCSDCGLDLVNELPDPATEAKTTGTDEDFLEVWAGEGQEKCVFFCLALREAGISYHVLQRRKADVKNVVENFSIGVPPESLDEARKIIEGNASGPDVEIPAQDDKAPTDDDDEHLDWKDESPDDATVEVAIETTRDGADMIVLALRENDIESRITILRDGSRKIFVTPHDESRGREIVREIQNETPPE